MSLIKYFPFLLILLLTSCRVQYSSLDIETNDHLELINEYETDTKTFDIISLEDHSKAFAITKNSYQEAPGITTLSEKESHNLNMGYSVFALKEIKKSGLENYHNISCLNSESYLSSFVSNNKLYLFSYIGNFSTNTPYSVFLRIVDLEKKSLIKEKVILRKYIADFEEWEFSRETNTFTPSLKVSPNKEYFAIYMGHEAGDLMAVWTVDVFDKDGERINRRILDRQGTIDFSIEDDGSIWLTGMYRDNYESYYNVEHIDGDFYRSDSYKLPRVSHKNKHNDDMLPDFKKRPRGSSKYKYLEIYYPTCQHAVKKDSNIVFFNYMYGNQGNGGLVATLYNEEEAKIEHLNLIPYHEMLGEAQFKNPKFEANFIPPLKISNVILHEDNYYVVLELFSKNFISIDGVPYLLGVSGDKYIVALDKDFKMKWANAQDALHQYFMSWENFTDRYALQGASSFEIKDNKLSGIMSCIFESNSFFSNEMGYYRVEYDLETGKLLDKKFLIDRNGNSKIFYNNFYPLDDMKIVIDQNFRDEFYLIKEK